MIFQLIFFTSIITKVTQFANLNYVTKNAAFITMIYGSVIKT